MNHTTLVVLLSLGIVYAAIASQLARHSHRRKQALGYHPAQRHRSPMQPWGSSGWWVVGIIILITLLILVVVS